MIIYNESYFVTINMSIILKGINCKELTRSNFDEINIKFTNYNIKKIYYYLIYPLLLL